MRPEYTPEDSFPIKGRPRSRNASIGLRVTAWWDTKTMCGLLLAWIIQPDAADMPDASVKEVDERIQKSIALRGDMDFRADMPGHQGTIGMVDTFAKHSDFIEYAVFWTEELREALRVAANFDTDLDDSAADGEKGGESN